jgi:multiple sugar transport system ATP-binding protein
VRLSLDQGRATIDTPVQAAPDAVGQPCSVGIRPEHLEADDRGPIRARVTASEFLGSETIAFAVLESGEPLTASFRGVRSVADQSILAYTVDPRHVHVFDDRDRALAPLERQPAPVSQRT